MIEERRMREKGYRGEIEAIKKERKERYIGFQPPSLIAPTGVLGWSTGFLVLDIVPWFRACPSGRKTRVKARRKARRLDGSGEKRRKQIAAVTSPSQLVVGRLDMQGDMECRLSLFPAGY